MARQFTENGLGVHLMSPLEGEYTLCGDAFDNEFGGSAGEAKATTKRVVTCPRCITVITECRGVRTSIHRGASDE